MCLPDLNMILSKLDSKKRRDYSKENARVDVMSFLMGKDKTEKDKTEKETGNGSFSNVKGRKPQENDCTNNRECAISIVEGRIESSVAKILNGVCGIRGKVDRNAIPAFESKVFDREKRQDWKLHMLIFDLQMYWMLKDRGGVMEFIKRPMSESLFSNIANEIKAIEDFDDDE